MTAPRPLAAEGLPTAADTTLTPASGTTPDRAGSPQGVCMQLEDLVLVSVDDHVVEPPDLFEGHLPERWRDVAPRMVTRDDGTDVWHYDGKEIVNIGLNA